MPKVRYLLLSGLIMGALLVVTLIAGALHHQVVIRVLKLN